MNYLKAIILLILISPFFAQAQKNELLLGLSAGINYPLGQFSSTDYIITEDNSIESQGQFAKLGAAFDFSANYRLGYYLGFAGRVMGGTNKVNTDEYSKALNSILNENGFEVVTASKGWGNFGFLAGGYFVIPVYDFYFDLRILGGYATLFSPEIRYYVSDIETENEELFISEKYNAGGFAYNIGLGVKYKFSSNKFILLNADYVAAGIKQDNITTLNPITKEEEIVNMNVDYQNITITLGIGYIF